MPEENGVSEHLNRTLLEHARAMLLTAGLPKFLWFETIRHATWLKNCMSTCTLNGKTPFEMRYKEKPNLENLPEWGTRVLCSMKVVENWMKKWMRAAGLATAQTAKATVCTGQENTT